MVGMIQNIQNQIVTILKANVTPVQSRVYVFPGTDEQISSQMPRITVSLISAPETFAGLGATNVPVWGMFTVQVNIWGKNPKVVDSVTDDAMDAIQNNRNGNGTNGRWLMLKANVATPTTKVEGQQIYQRTLNVTGRWLQTA